VVEKSKGMSVVSVPLEKLILDDRNARRGDVAAIVESLTEFGQHRPVVVQKSTNKIIAGNHLYMAAEALGWESVDAYYVDDDDAKALRRSLADNGTGDLAKWENDTLAALLQEAGDDVPGFDEAFLDKLLKDAGPEEKEPDPIFPIVARVNEEYDYVLVVAQNAVDCNWLREKFGVREEQSYKDKAVAKSHVVTVERLQELWAD
jgi:ParB-like chromosome segregation protein Spo0J